MVVERASTIQHNAELVDEIDLTAGFAQAAVDLNYVRPTLNDRCVCVSPRPSVSTSPLSFHSDAPALPLQSLMAATHLSKPAS